MLLALDTTTRAGSVALVRAGRVLIERAGNPDRTHAERLPQAIVSVLDEAGVALSAVDAYAVASGPGSFTGLRIGIATMQGFAFASQRPLTAVSALEALAQWAAADLPVGRLVGVWTDAYRREVFSALYGVADAAPYSPGRVVEIEGPAVGDPAATASRWVEQGHAPDVWAGDGAAQYAAIVGGRGPILPSPALAGVIGLLAAHPARAGLAADPARVQPLYVRRPDAELARERRPEDDRTARAEGAEG